MGVKENLVRAAARNNAEFCAAVCRSHGLVSEFGEHAWTASVRTPVYYPDAVTLVPGADATQLLARIETTRPGASVKDSFADLDLTGAGFEVLFEARWIHRVASGAGAVSAANVLVPGSDLVWTVVDSVDGLAAWALAWDGGAGNAGVFRAELLEEPTTRVLAGSTADGRVVAGAVASRSEHVVGISNVFALRGGVDAAWSMVLGAVSRLFPAVSVVGYEDGEHLDAALRHGFEVVGSLRVWRQRPEC